MRTCLDPTGHLIGGLGSGRPAACLNILLPFLMLEVRGVATWEYSQYKLHVTECAAACEACKARGKSAKGRAGCSCADVRGPAQIKV